MTTPGAEGRDRAADAGCRCDRQLSACGNEADGPDGLCPVCRLRHCLLAADEQRGWFHMTYGALQRWSGEPESLFDQVRRCR